MLRILLIFSIAVLASFNAVGQTKPVVFQDLEALQVKEPRPVVVLLMTQWCKYCHAMKNTMVKNRPVSELLDLKFYTVFFDAEEKNDIFFAGRAFKNKSGGHELAQELGTVNGQVSYPSLCILNSRNEIIYQHDGFLSSQAMLDVLRLISK